MLTLVTGGAASGKSEYAERLLDGIPHPKIYLATMYPYEDEESRGRIAKHRAARAGRGFQTVEQPFDLLSAAVPPGSAVLLECLSNLAANELFLPEGAGKDALAEICAGVERLIKQTNELVIVSNEIFSDGVCYDSKTQEYIRLLGALNTRLARRAQRVVEVVCGIPVVMKGDEGP